MKEDLEDITVETLGARGDGIAQSRGARLYVAFATPGDHVWVRRTGKRGDGFAAEIAALLEPGPSRTEPVCRHFGTCGGCATQHIQPTATAEIKRDLLIQALARHGITDVPVAATVSIPPGERRRARLSYRSGREAILGFNQRNSRLLENLEECPALRNGMAALIEPIRRMAATIGILGKGADIQITETDNGIDLLIIPKREDEPDLRTRETLAAFADEHDLCRISWQTGADWEPVAQRRPARVRFGPTTVNPPPNAFLQPSRQGEAAIVDLVCKALAPSAPTHIADFYAGCGALTFPLSALARVTAFEGNDEMADAITRAASEASVTVERRDLVRQPLSTMELNTFDAAVFDPPRAGARPLAEALADSTISTVVAVSCNPSTLGRDLRLLMDGGYRIEDVTPIDQFPWSSHLEAVAVLRR
jgi:23S rRNA (uracil1939-C5)-methyltransferase